MSENLSKENFQPSADAVLSTEDLDKVAGGLAGIKCPKCGKSSMYFQNVTVDGIYCNNCGEKISDLKW